MKARISIFLLIFASICTNVSLPEARAEGLDGNSYYMFLFNILEKLLSELADNKDGKIKLIERCGLDPFLWEQLKRIYGYKSENPSVKDFAVELFKSCYAMGTDGNIKLNSDALVFLKRCKDSMRQQKAFEHLSDAVTCRPQ